MIGGIGSLAKSRTTRQIIGSLLDRQGIVPGDGPAFDRRVEVYNERGHVGSLPSMRYRHFGNQGCAGYYNEQGRLVMMKQVTQ